MTSRFIRIAEALVDGNAILCVARYSKSTTITLRYDGGARDVHVPMLFEDVVKAIDDWQDEFYRLTPGGPAESAPPPASVEAPAHDEIEF